MQHYAIANHMICDALKISRKYFDMRFQNLAKSLMRFERFLLIMLLSLQRYMKLCIKNWKGGIYLSYQGTFVVVSCGQTFLHPRPMHT